MANKKSAKKRAAKSEAQRERNRGVRSTMRTAVKRVRQAAAGGDVEAAEGLLREAISIVDVTAKKGVIHRNTAARTKSRLAAEVRKQTAK
jgi:small subunit ribosomal protein S20